MATRAANRQLEVEAARAVLGGFEVDPASSQVANRTMKAVRYLQSIFRFPRNRKCPIVGSEGLRTIR